MTAVDGRGAASGQRTGTVLDARQVLTGVLISGVFGLAWGQWAASGLSHGAALGARIASTVIGVSIAVRAARLRRGTPRSADSMFSSVGYRAVVATEIVVLVAAVIALVATHGSRFLPVAVAATAAAHFAGFGQLFDRFFRLLAGGLLLAAVIGLVIALDGGSPHGVEAVTGLVAAVTLFAGAIARLVAAGGITASAGSPA